MSNEQLRVESLPEAVVAVITKEKKVLIIQRGADVPFPGYWAPLSGKMEPQEDQAEAVVREVREEVGLTVRPVRKVWECTLQVALTSCTGGLRNGCPETSGPTHERLLTPVGLTWRKFFDLRERSRSIVSSSKGFFHFSDAPSNQETTRCGKILDKPRFRDR
jgi:8-oxo-dGTP pyrophosphatase MutT (NUDIX family)